MKFVSISAFLVSALCVIESGSAGIVSSDPDSYPVTVGRQVAHVSAHNLSFDSPFATFADVRFEINPPPMTPMNPGDPIGVRICSTDNIRVQIAGLELEDSVRNFNFGETIGENVFWLNDTNFRFLHNYGDTTEGPFIDGSPNSYIGVRLTNVANEVFYGWIRYQDFVEDGAGTIHGWAFENTGGSITAGQLVAIPEPSALLLVGSVLGLGFLRRRR